MLEQQLREAEPATRLIEPLICESQPLLVQISMKLPAGRLMRFMTSGRPLASESGKVVDQAHGSEHRMPQLQLAEQLFERETTISLDWVESVLAYVQLARNSTLQIS
jgi:hypothetical protein